MEVKQDYDSSKIGSVPDDWKVLELGDLGKFSKGQGIRKNESNSGDIPCVRYGELYTRHNNIIHNYFSFINPEISKTSKRLKFGDILFAGSGETKEEIGKCAAFLDNREVYAGGDIVILSPSDADSRFLGYLLNFPFVNRQKASRGQGDAVVHISARQLSGIKVPIPPCINEQVKIATALSDIDALINSLKNLIEKKRMVKEGAMKQLLKPMEGWDLKQLGKLVRLNKGEQLNRSDMIESGRYPALNGGIEPSGFTEKWNREGLTITISEGGNSCGFVNLVYNKFWCGGHCYSLEIFDNETNLNYLYHVLKFLEKEIMGLRVGSGLPNIQKGRLNAFSVYKPPLKEQVYISSILDAINSEILSLKLKLDKYEYLKQGIMQNLLTGKIRLT